MAIWPDIPRYCFGCVHRRGFVTKRRKPRFLHSQQNSCIQGQNRVRTSFFTLSPPKDRYSHTVTFSGKEYDAQRPNQQPQTHT